MPSSLNSRVKKTTIIIINDPFIDAPSTTNKDKAAAITAFIYRDKDDEDLGLLPRESLD